MKEVEDESKMWSPMRWLRKVIVEPVLFLYMFSIYLLFGVFQNLVYNSVCRLKYDDVVCGNLSAYEVSFVAFCFIQGNNMTKFSIC